jgi:hypothetical protein
MHYGEYNILRNTSFIECGTLSPEEITDIIFKSIAQGI